MVLGSYVKHPGLALRATFILARNSALVRYNGLALGADAFPTATHGVLLLMSGHDLDFLMNKYSPFRLLLVLFSLSPVDFSYDERGQLSSRN